MKPDPTRHVAIDSPNGAQCRQEPGVFVPVVDRSRCEGKADCVRVCPTKVFTVGTLPKDLRHGLGFKGTVKGVVHRWQQALIVKPDGCEACGLCVNACPERAITLART
jgi:4Fe-4S ferredoxin